MPTSRKRHTITETSKVEQALSPLRKAGVPIDIPELVIKGADVKLNEARKAATDDERRLALRKRFLKRTHEGGGIELTVALKVREDSWIEES
jgi:hypothetical protein